MTDALQHDLPELIKHDQPLPQAMQETASLYWQRLIDSGADLSDVASHENTIKRVMALSDFVAENLITCPQLLTTLLTDGLLFDKSPDFNQRVSDSISECESEDALCDGLREQRQLWMTYIAWRDLLNLQTIEASLQQVSDLADALINNAYHALYRMLCERYGTPQGKHGAQPMLILGMGKLGGKELNFSSDIDLIFVYPQNGELQTSRKSVEHQQFFTKLAQKLIAALHQTTAKGQVFRVDMRLRPFGESGPLVTHFAALEDYLQDQGREWERYAMIKARILNDDGAYAQQLKALLTPFTFRRYLDFGAIESLRNMKRLINQEVRRRNLQRNIKLGAGGIREVEFIVQSFQLIRGGRDVTLRSPSLLHNLTTLVDSECLPQQDADTLRQSYLFLRKVEHCLQQFGDKQTQELPDNTLDQARLAYVFGSKSFDALLTQIETHQTRIHEQFHMLIGEEEDTPVDCEHEAWQEMVDLWQLSLDQEECERVLASRLDSHAAERFAETLLAFKQNIRSRGVGQKGRNALNALMPALLHCTLELPENQANTALVRTLDVLDAILGRTTYLQLLDENTGALKQLIKLCSASPWITEQMQRYPILLDELLNPYALFHPTPLAEYRSDLRQAMLRIDPEDMEQQMESLRQYKLSEQLHIAAADITGVMPVMQVSDHLTYLAEAIIEEAVSLAWQQLTQRHGSPEGTNPENKRFAVIAYGKLGGIELGYGSDLDLVFVHGAEPNTETDGVKPIGANHFYTKLAQRIMHLFNTKTSSGDLYEVDLRLRPSGNAGLLACHINGFEQYQLSEAWTWEHQALVRARMVFGDIHLNQRFIDVRREVLCQKRDEAELRQQVVEMREKMRQHLSTESEQYFDLKQDRGGITDIEFLVQYWILKYAQHDSTLCTWSDNVRILESLHASGFISETVVSQLTNAYLTFRNLNHRLALQQCQTQPIDDEISELREQVKRIWQETFGESA